MMRRFSSSWLVLLFGALLCVGVYFSRPGADRSGQTKRISADSPLQYQDPVKRNAEAGSSELSGADDKTSDSPSSRRERSPQEESIPSDFVERGQAVAVAPLRGSPEEGSQEALERIQRYTQKLKASNKRGFRVFRGASWETRALAWSPKGDLLASGAWQRAGSFDLCKIKIWDVPSGAEVCTLPGHRDTILSLAFHPTWKVLASASQDGTLKLWDLEKKAELRSLSPAGGAIHSIGFSPDGSVLISGGNDRQVSAWELESGPLLRTAQQHSSRVVYAAVQPDGRITASGDSDGTFRLWDLQNGQVIREFRTRQQGSTEAYAWSPSQQLLAVGGGSLTLYRVQGETERLKLDKQTWGGPYEYLSISPQSILAAFTLSNSFEIQLIDLSTSKVLEPIETESSWTAIAFSPDGTVLASGGSGYLVLWDMSQ